MPLLELGKRKKNILSIAEVFRADLERKLVNYYCCFLTVFFFGSCFWMCKMIFVDPV